VFKKGELILEIGSSIPGTEKVRMVSEVFSSPFRRDIHVKSRGL
jgi:hypothetical protein